MRGRGTLGRPTTSHQQLFPVISYTLHHARGRVQLHNTRRTFHRPDLSVAVTLAYSPYPHFIISRSQAVKTAREAISRNSAESCSRQNATSLISSIITPIDCCKCRKYFAKIQIN